MAVQRLFSVILPRRARNRRLVQFAALNCRISAIWMNLPKLHMEARPFARYRTTQIILLRLSTRIIFNDRA